MTREEAIYILKNSAWLGTDEMEKAIEMAIETLSADAVQGVGRYEKAMQKLREMPRYLNGVKAKQIAKVPSEAVQNWIPCSERLPSNDGCVLVTIDDAIEFGKYKDGEWSIWVCEHWDEWEAKGVDAWMPLPEPYKGGEDE